MGYTIFFAFAIFVLFVSRVRGIQIDLDRLLKYNKFEKTYTLKYTVKKTFFRAVKNEKNYLVVYLDFVNKIKEIDIDEVENEIIRLEYTKGILVSVEELPLELREYAKSKEILCTTIKVLKNLKLDLENEEKDKNEIKDLKGKKYNKNYEKRIFPEEINIKGKKNPKRIIAKESNFIYDTIKSDNKIKEYSIIEKENSPIKEPKESFLKNLFKKPDRL